jgi:hypothetical protein
VRRALGQAKTTENRVVRRSGGYLLDIDPDQVDLYRFRQFVEQARTAEVDRGERAFLLRRRWRCGGHNR